jgi:very-short-patch-repair endonuclease
MAAYRGFADTRSGNERRFLELIREAGLSEPGVNVVVAGIVVDFIWPQQRLVVEVDSYTYHHTPADRAEDRRKQRIVEKAGYTVRRFIDTELSDAPTQWSGTSSRGSALLPRRDEARRVPAVPDARPVPTPQPPPTILSGVARTTTTASSR